MDEKFKLLTFTDFILNYGCALKNYTRLFRFILIKLNRDFFQGTVAKFQEILCKDINAQFATIPSLVCSSIELDVFGFVCLNCLFLIVVSLQ